MFKQLTAIALLILTLASKTVAQADPPTTGTLLGDARIIITSDKNDVRLWAHPPRVLVLSDASVRNPIRKMIQQVEDAVTSPFGDSLFGDVQFHDIPENLGAGQDKIYTRIRKNESSGFRVEIDLGSGFKHTTDILVVIADRPNLALMNGLWAMDRRNSRAQLEGGRSRCFYSTRSVNGVRAGAYVSIFSPAEEEYLNECIWEELLHTLGPLIDAKGSDFFTFDDTGNYFSELPAKEKREMVLRKKANDLLLIRALYESGVAPGGSPDTVITYLEDLITTATD